MMFITQNTNSVVNNIRIMFPRESLEYLPQSTLQLNIPGIHFFPYFAYVGAGEFENAAIVEMFECFTVK